MSEAEHPEILIIRRPLEDGDEAHHGGVWKIAYADFMTAMMAFFLVLWLINSTNKETRASVARYFNPVQLTDTTVSKKGVHDPTQQNGPPAQQAPTNPAPPTTSPDASPPAAAASPDPDAKPTPINSPPQTSSPAAPVAHFTDTELFRDPYAVLAEIAGSPGKGPQSQIVPPNVKQAGAGQSGLTGGNAYRDPFAPMTFPVPPDAKAEPENPFASAVPLAAPAAASTSAGTPAAAPASGSVPPQVGSSASVTAPAQQIVSPGGGAAKPETTQKGPATTAAEVAPLRAAIARVVGQESGGDASKGPGFDVENTDEGLLISLTDNDNFGMFAVGSAEPQPKVVAIMAQIAGLLKTRPGNIIIRGYTDATPFKSGPYDNWRLSADRAQMAHYMLVRGGLDENRIERIEGWADRDLKVPSDPDAAENRRIEILLQKAKP